MRLLSTYGGSEERRGEGGGGGPKLCSLIWVGNPSSAHGKQKDLLAHD